MEENKDAIKTFHDWFNSQQRFKTQKEFAIATGIPRSTLGFYIQGLRRPLEEHRKILYEVTRLDCFNSEINTQEKKEELDDIKMKEKERKSELPLHIQLQNWFSSQTKYKTKKELAKAAGIGYSNLNRYFRGKSQPSKDIQEKILEITGLDIFLTTPGVKEEQRKIEQQAAIKTTSPVSEKVSELQEMISSYKTTESETNLEETLERRIDKRESISSDDIESLFNQIKITIQKQNLKIRALEEENKNLRKNVIDFASNSNEDRIFHIEKLCKELLEQVRYISGTSLDKKKNKRILDYQNPIDFMIYDLEQVRESGKMLWDIEISEAEKEKFYLKVKDTIILLDRLTDKLFKGRKKLIPQGFSTDMLQFLSKTMESGEKK